MGKLQSKHASKRRERPEGGSFASNALTCQRELERTASTRKDSSGTELREDSQTDHHCHLKVSLLPQRASDREPSSHLTGNKHLRKRSSHAGDSECNVLLEEDARQEWVFTLYDFDNSGKVTKEDMSSLMHSIYEVIEASVRQSCGGSTALRVKLVVTPSSSPEKTSQTAATRQQGTAQEVRSPERRTYCVDENTERRNHYLDLAGIENYSSKFDDEEPSSQEPKQDARSALQHPPVAVKEHCISSESRRGVPVFRSHGAKAVAVGENRNGGEGKLSRLHGHSQHTALCCHPTQCQHQAHISLQRTHSKRLRSRGQDASRPAGFQTQPGTEREILPSMHVSCGVLAPPGNRHDHHHHHEHHHHHHHHHYHPS
ncbi:protein naked cuticle homolog 2 [Myripristis murdjan]|uniref:protein naked cuticle homolog 2 n=1 Tax=Myripristis murdjan TaxID=586833 RepID=UPI00117620CA|nr:protein naked cuticle homolog 2-like [Myripristis murdjan]